MTAKFFANRLCVFLLATLLLAVFFAQASRAESLTASVDRDSLGLQETFTLTLRYDDQISAQPDYTSLQKDFDILNTQSGSQVSVVNGEVTSLTQWKIALAPKRIGTLLIPSFNIKGAVSDATPITVTRNSQGPKNASDQVSVEIETNKDSLKVQEQLLLTVRLFTRVSLSDASLEELKIPDALVIELGDKQYQTRINGQQALVVETRYAVFPQKSGSLTIPSLMYQVNPGSGSQDMWNRIYGNRASDLLRLRTDEREIPVDPAPQGNNTQAWLPAKNIQLSEHWSADKDSMKVGEPLTRSITIQGEGITAAQLPPLPSVEVKGLSLYQDKAQTDEQKSDKGITGSRIETTAIVANRPGKFTLPEIKLTWWDTEDKTFKSASLPATSLKVTGIASSSSEDESSSQDSAPEPAADTELLANTPIAPSQAKMQNIPLWIYLGLGIGLLLLVWLAISNWQLRRLLKGKQQQQSHALQQQLSSEEQAWKQVKKALKAADAETLRRALLGWAAICFKGQTMHSLTDIARQCSDSDLSEEFNKLDSQIYGQQGKEFNGEKLLELLANYRRKANRDQKEKLQPLYPE